MALKDIKLYKRLYNLFLVFGIITSGSIIVYQITGDHNYKKNLLCESYHKESMKVNGDYKVPKECGAIAAGAEEHINWAFNRGWDDRYYRRWKRRMSVMFLSLLAFLPVIALRYNRRKFYKK
jgi:hypothetical protein